MTGRTTLSWASRKGDDATVSELLACGADPNITDSWGMSSLHYAVAGSSEKCLRLLLTSKAVLEAKNRNGNTPLAVAAPRHGEGVRVLLEFGADVENQDHSGRRPIHHAVSFDCPQNVIHLLHAGADMFARTSSGYTTLDIAMKYNAHSTLRVLLEAHELSARPMNDVFSVVAMALAASCADQETLNILLPAVLEGSHLSLGSENKTYADAVQMAKWRRGNNQEWSEEALRPRDADPIAWYQSFQSLFWALRGSEPRIPEDVNGETDSRLDYSTGEDSSDTESTDGSEDEESWEDAPESQGEHLT